MGLIMVIGIVAKNGILLLDADEKFRAQAASDRQTRVPLLPSYVATWLAKPCCMLLSAAFAPSS